MFSLLNVKATPGSELINHLLTKLLDKNYYEKDREFIKDFEKKQLAVKSAHFEKIVDPCKQTLLEM